VPLNCWYLYTSLQGVIFHNTEIFFSGAVRTSYLPRMKFCLLQCCISHDLYTGLSSDVIQCNCMTAFAADTVTEYCSGKMNLKGNPLYFMLTSCSANIYGNTDI